MADLTQIQDKNGKSFSVDVSKICDINGDMGDSSSASITDSQKNRVTKVHDIEYVNQNGETIDSMQLLKDMSSGKTQVLALDVEMEATHSGKNHNYCIYYEDSMEKDSESFMNPFKKPMLKNHNDHSGEPLGRITQSWYGPSELTDERSAIHLKARVTDQDAIPKFLDGRYGTVSIGGTMGTVTCNVCGKTILKDGKFKFCGHWRGESYKDQMCYWGARDIEYHEVSVVNNPADDFAQIMKVTVVTDSDEKKDNKEENQMSAPNNDNTQPVSNASNNADAAKKSVCDIIDQLLNNNSEVPVQDNNNTDNSDNIQDNNDNKDENNSENLEDKTADEKIKDLEKQVADSNEKIKDLEQQIEDAKANTTKLENELEDSRTENSDLKDKCLALATANKELVADSIIAKEQVADDKIEDRKKELMELSMKELNKLVEDSSAKDDIQHRQPAQVQNPSLANPEKNNKDSNGSTDTDKKTTTDNRAKKTVDDFAQDIIGKLVR